MTVLRSDKAQRIRIRFARGPEATAIGHLDASRCWESALREAGAVLSYSQGNRPSVRITLAAGLGANVTSDGELLDALLAEFTDVLTLIERVLPHLPAGLTALDAREVGVSLPSLPSLVRFADYEVDVRSVGPDVLRSRIVTLLAAESLPWVDTRGEKTREYDLRPLVQDIRVDAVCEDAARLSMRLRSDSSGVGRPDQIVKALGLDEPSRIHRLRLVLAETSPAHDAWRRKGRYVI